MQGYGLPVEAGQSAEPKSVSTRHAVSLLSD